MGERKLKVKQFTQFDKNLKEKVFVTGKLQHNVIRQVSRIIDSEEKVRVGLKAEDSKLILIYDVWIVKVPHKDGTKRIYHRGFNKYIGQVNIEDENFKKYYSMFFE